MTVSKKGTQAYANKVNLKDFGQDGGVGRL